MGTMIDIFNNDAFSVVELSESINMMPNQYGLLGKMNLFPDKGVKTTSIAIEINNGVLNLLSSTKRSGNALKNKSGKRKIKSFNIPNFTVEDTIPADDIQNVKAFGKEGELATVQDVVLDKLEEMKGKHDITREYLRVTALRGIIKDGNDNTILDLFSDFGVTQKEVYFDLSDETTSPNTKIREVARYIRKNLKGDICTGIMGLCSPGFFDSLVEHPDVRDAYAYQQGKNILRDDLSEDGFTYQGITFKVYDASAEDMEGTEQQFIPEGDCRFFPVGTKSTFKTYNAPADFNECVNTIGQPYYAKKDTTKFDRGVDILTQMNPLPLCIRPAVLVRGNKNAES